MSFDAALAALVRAAVREEMAPVMEELAALRAERAEAGVPLDEAAKRLGVSRRTVNRMVKSGALPSIPGVKPARVLLSDVLRIRGS